MASQMEKNRNALSLTSMRFNRYLVFRYITAIFFFTNLYWLIILSGTPSFALVAPLVLLVLQVLIVIEQVSKYFNDSNSLKFTKLGYSIQLIANILLMLVTLTGQAELFFPFWNEKAQSLILLVLGLGSVLSGIMLWRAQVISQDKDKYLVRMREFAASLN